MVANWMDSAVCRQPGAKPDDWFPEPEDEIGVTYATTICNTQCLVRDMCARYAIANGEQHGIWGGMTETELHDAALEYSAVSFRDRENNQNGHARRTTAIGLYGIGRSSRDIAHMMGLHRDTIGRYLREVRYEVQREKLFDLEDA